MAEIPDLPTLAQGDTDDNVQVLVYDASAGANKSRQQSRGNFLHDVVRENGNHTLGTTEITELASATFTGGATLSDMVFVNADLVFPTIADGASNTQTMTLTGAATSNILVLTPGEEIADGLIVTAWISAGDTVSVKITNVRGSSWGGDTYTFRAIAMAVA